VFQEENSVTMFWGGRNGEVRLEAGNSDGLDERAERFR
jgi:hypothetical protein